MRWTRWAWQLGTTLPVVWVVQNQVISVHWWQDDGSMLLRPATPDEPSRAPGPALVLCRGPFLMQYLPPVSGNVVLLK
jgi:hypothetical protein